MKFIYKALFIPWLLACSVAIFPSDNSQYLKPLIFGIITGIGLFKIHNFFYPPKVVIQSSPHSKVVYHVEGGAVIEEIRLAEGAMVTINGENVELQPQDEHVRADGRPSGLAISTALASCTIASGAVAFYFGQQCSKN